MFNRRVARKPGTNRFSIPDRSAISNRTSLNADTPTEDLTIINKDQEANINYLNLRLEKMEQKFKTIEGILTRVSAIDHTVEYVGNESTPPADGDINVAQKHQKSEVSLKKQENMYRALGIKPPASSV
ncbi:hypothetical protein ACHAP3_005782 [Botrytis cinerea]